MGNLENVTSENLRDILDELDDNAAIKRVMVALAYNEIDDLSQNRAAEIFGFSSGWASKWFTRLERLDSEPFGDVLSDDPRSGRPAKLTSEQRAQFEAVLQEPPRSVGFDDSAWTVDLADRYLRDTFGVEYSDRHLRRLLHEAGLSWEPTRRTFDSSIHRTREGVEEAANPRERYWTPDTD